MRSGIDEQRQNRRGCFTVALIVAALIAVFLIFEVSTSDRADLNEAVSGGATG